MVAIVTPHAGIADEAAKLLGALEGWLRNAAGTPAATTGSARQLRPDVVRHLSIALGAAILAARALTETQDFEVDVPAAEPGAATREDAATVVQHITVN